jgi:hypothetical protein
MKFSDVLQLSCLAPLARGCLLPEERAGGFRTIKPRQATNNGLGIGTGDRFSGGTVVPKGLGTRPAGSKLGLILNPTEVMSAMKALEAEYGMEIFKTPHKTYEGREVYGGVVGGLGKCKDATRIFFNGAIHARERGSMDNIIYFVSDLLYAYKNKQGVTYGGKSYTSCDVAKALSAGIVFLPLSNPDGVAWDQSTNSCWRKNRNPASSKPNQPGSIGIDLNRNFDFIWDFNKYFAPEIAPEVASTDPNSEIFHGTAPFSEPETQNIKWVLDTFSKVRWFMDVHSFAGDMLYSWGSDTNQNDKPYMNFLNDTYNKDRGLIPDPSPARAYGEYIPAEEEHAAIFTANTSAAAMTAATGREHVSVQGAAFYPTSGASDDYSYSRKFANPALNTVYAYTYEFGFGNELASCPFYPTEEEYRLNMLEANAGMMEFILSARQMGLGDPVKCSA